MIARDDCLAMDAADPLAPYRARFVLPEGVLYLDGNSLGALPKTVHARLADVTEREWGRDLIRSWNTNDWIGLPQKVGGKLARFIGAQAHEVIAADSTSVNIFKLAAAALTMQPDRPVIVTEEGNFPTDIYMLEGLAELTGRELRIRPRDEIVDALDERTALLLLTHVHYKTAEIWDMAAITAAAHATGALTLWDLSHSTGALPVDLGAANADLAVGCGYKYLNGGPGAPAYLFVAERLQGRLKQPLTGWMGHARPFDFDGTYTPAPGIDQTLCGTPVILALSALDTALDLFGEVDMATLREKSQKLGDLFIALIDERCAGFGFAVASPRDAAARGSHVSVRHAAGYAIMQALIARGVIGDFRAPDNLRFGFTPLYQRYTDIFDAVGHLEEIMLSGEWNSETFRAKAAVT